VVLVIHIKELAAQEAMRELAALAVMLTQPDLAVAAVVAKVVLAVAAVAAA
jgi:hypothetical protein